MCQQLKWWRFNKFDKYVFYFIQSSYILSLNRPIICNKYFTNILEDYFILIVVKNIFRFLKWRQVNKLGSFQRVPYSVTIWRHAARDDTATRRLSMTDHTCVRYCYLNGYLKSRHFLPFHYYAYTNIVYYPAYAIIMLIQCYGKGDYPHLTFFKLLLWT